MKLAFTAVIADLAYIIMRLQLPAESAEDAFFAVAVPEMLRCMLLCVVIITAFGGLATRILAESAESED